MQTLTPSAQEGTQGPEGAAAGETITAAPDPLFSGPAPALWAGAGAFIIIFVFVLVLIIRGRVVRPSGSKVQHNPPNYFEPAGADADISFEEDEPAAEQQYQQEQHAAEQDHQEQWSDDAVEEPEAAISEDRSDGRHRGDLLNMDDESAHAEEERAPKKKKSAFAGLFSKKPANEENFESQAGPEDATPAEEPYTESYFDEPAAAGYPPEPARAAPEPAADEARITHAEDAAQQALQRATEAETLARDLARVNARTEQTIAHGLQENEAALTAMNERLTVLSKEFQARLETAPAQAAHMHDDHDRLSEAHFAEFADLIGEQFESLRGAVNEAIDRLSRRIDHLPAAAPHAVAPTAARVQLSDLLSDALPAQRYALSCKLSSGRTADACIHMPGRLAPIAVDARFPVEIFDAWQHALRETSAPKEEATALRRIILRHIADAGEKLIIEGETADCAMMFVPSEHILSEMHSNFPDLVQESYRARVWMVSPTSLMATLHTISAVMAGSDLVTAPTTDPGDEVEKQLTALRERILALESARGAGGQERAEQHQPSAAPQPTAHAASYAGGGYYDESASAARPRDTEPANEDKPPFPLR